MNCKQFFIENEKKFLTEGRYKFILLVRLKALVERERIKIVFYMRNEFKVG